MKKIIMIAAILGSSLLAFASPVNDKVLATFNHTFLNAVNPTWTESGDRYEVSFSYYGMPTKIEYDAKGNILSSERETTVALIPMSIFKDLKASYPDMKVNKVTEVTRKKKLYYVIKLESAGELRTVRCDMNGNMKTLNKCEL